jgi:hypothetical protein
MNPLRKHTNIFIKLDTNLLPLFCSSSQSPLCCTHCHIRCIHSFTFAAHLLSYSLHTFCHIRSTHSVTFAAHILSHSLHTFCRICCTHSVTFVAHMCIFFKYNTLIARYKGRKVKLSLSKLWRHTGLSRWP